MKTEHSMLVSLQNRILLTRVLCVKYVSLDELGQQYQTIKAIFRKMEETFTDEQKQLVHNLIVESEVYQAVRQHFNEQIEFDEDFVI